MQMSLFKHHCESTPPAAPCDCPETPKVNLKNRVWKVAAGMGQEMLSCPSAALGRERFVCLLVQWDGLLAYIVLWWQL